MSFRNDQNSYVTASEVLATTRIHVVIGWEGEYSDRQEYVAGAFWDLETAKRHILEKTAEGRKAAQKRDAWIERRYQLENAAREAKRGLNAEEEEEISRQMGGPCPRQINYDNYYVVSLPIGEWGKWYEFDTDDSLGD